MARRLVQRWGLRLYSADTQTWRHRDRAIAAGIEGALRYESLPREERLTQSLDDRRAMWLGDERAVMVLDDVRALPRAPLVVAEGDAIEPRLIDPARAVWLQPTQEFQLQHRWAEYAAICHSVEDARDVGVPILTVDGARSVGEVVDAVEDLLGDALRSGPFAESLDERRRLLREANLDAVSMVREGCARPWATDEPETQVRSFLCECGDRSCDADADATVAAAAAAPVLAPGHERRVRER